MWLLTTNDAPDFPQVDDIPWSCYRHGALIECSEAPFLGPSPEPNLAFVLGVLRFVS